MHSPIESSIDEIKHIRNQARKARRNLLSDEREAKEKIIYDKIKQHPEIKKAQHVAIFLSFDGEVNTQPIIEYLWQQGKFVYLPIVDPTTPHHLLFLPYTRQTKLIVNKLNILEPEFNIALAYPHQALDVIITPLVAFDEQGYRIGMGGGYYDRLLENYQKYDIYPIGLAFNCQKVPSVPNQPWDIKLAEIIHD